MTEKLQTQINNTQELSATSQDLSRFAISTKDSYISNNSKLSEQFSQDLIDYRYEQARIERKRVRESKGQNFEQYVNEIVAKKELEKSKIKPEPKKAEQSKTNNSILQRLKALAAVALVSGGAMLSSCGIESTKNKVETKKPVKTEQVKKVEQTKQTESKKTTLGYTSRKFKFTIPNVEASTIKTGSIVNEYRSNGVSFKGRFVMMPSGALFNLEGRSVKITPKNIYAIENDRSGYFNLNDTKATKKVTPGMKISILNGEIVMVPDRPVQKKTGTKQVVPSKKEISNQSKENFKEIFGPVYKPFPEPLKPQKHFKFEAEYYNHNGYILLKAKKGTIGDIAIALKLSPINNSNYILTEYNGINVSNNFFDQNSTREKKIIIPFDIPSSELINNLDFIDNIIKMKDIKMKKEMVQVDGKRKVNMYFLEITKPINDNSSPKDYIKQVEFLLSSIDVARSFDHYNNSTRSGIEFFYGRLNYDRSKYESDKIIEMEEKKWNEK